MNINDLEEVLSNMLDEKLAPIMTDLREIRRVILDIEVDLLLTDAILDSIENTSMV